MQHIFENANFNFVKWRWHAIAFSWLVVLAGVGVASRAAACRWASTSAAAPR